MPEAGLVERVQAYTDHVYGRTTCVRDLRPMRDGHAGLTFGLRVQAAEDGACLARLVLRLAPAGVRRQGNTDVYRQAPLLRALSAAGLPVAPVRWAEPGEEWLGAPFVMTEWLPGRVFFPWDPGEEWREPGAAAACWRQTAAALVRFHRFDWRRGLAGWAAPRSLREEVAYWDPILARAPEAAWITMGAAVRESLLAGPLPDSPVGLLHGDYQPGNALFRREAGGGVRLRAVLDWELAGIGAQLLDIGWLQMMGDRESWHESSRPLAPLPVAELAAIYQEAMGQRFADLAWFRALAGYRFGCIACLNVKLHRRGQREDRLWEELGRSIPRLFARAGELLRRRGGRVGG